MKRCEILDFVEQKYPNYPWSLRTLCCRWKYFVLKFIDYDTKLDSIEEAVRMEIDSTGRLLGYRALHKKLREVHGLTVPRNIVYGMMENVDPSGLEERGPVGKSNPSTVSRAPSRHARSLERLPTSLSMQIQSCLSEYASSP